MTAPDTPLADVLIDLGAPGRKAPAPLQWLAMWLPDADRRHLSKDDLARIDAYAGEATDLHQLLPAILPLKRPVWFETSVTAQHGTAMILGYGAVPAPTGISIGWTCLGPGKSGSESRIIGPLGPVEVTPTEMHRPPGLSDFSWDTLRSAAGTIVRALLLNLGTPPERSPFSMLERIGKALHGEHWRMPTSRDVEMSDETFRSWKREHVPLPRHHPVFRRLLPVVQRHRAELEQVERELMAWLGEPQENSQDENR